MELLPEAERHSYGAAEWSDLRDHSENRRYILKERVDAGGYGEVWLALDSRLSQIVAIKKLHPYLADDPSILSLFRNEVIAGRLINCSHVVKVFDLIDIDRKPCLVMEYIEGCTLQEFCRNEQFSRDVLYKVVYQLSKGLAAIHAAGFSHRDLNYTNVIVNDYGHAVIVDLGLARLRTENDGRVVVGSFTAPELERTPAFERADVYSFGILVQNLVNAATPGGNKPDLLLPIISRCTQADPCLRFRDGIELLEAVEALIKTENAADIPNSAPRVGYLKRFAQISLLAGALVFVIVVACRNGSSNLGKTEFVVESKTTDPSSVFLADMVAAYLESVHRAVSRPYRPLSAGILAAKPSFSNIGVIEIDVDAAGQNAIVKIAKMQKMQPKAHALDINRSVALVELLRLIARDLALPLPSADWSENGISAEKLRIFPKAWTFSTRELSQFTEMSDTLEVLPHGIPALLVKARVNQKAYEVLKDPLFRSRAALALEDLEKLSIRTTGTILVASSLASVDSSNGIAESLRAQLRFAGSKAPLLRKLSELAVKAGFGEEAFQFARKAVELDPFSAQNYVAQARAASLMWRDSDALPLLSNALVLDPNNSAISSQLGIAYIRLGRYEDARQSLAQSLEAKPSTETYVLLGLANILCGDDKQGVLLLRGAVATDRSLYALGTLGAALRWAGDQQASREILAEALLIGNERSKDPIELGRLALVHAQLGHFSEADELIAKAAGVTSANATEIIYDQMVLDALAGRKDLCRLNYKRLSERQFPMAFALRDPQVAAIVTQQNH